MNHALELARRILASPPTRLSSLEALLGPLHVDFAGGEGMGAFFRPRLVAAPAAPSAPSGPFVPPDRVAPGLAGLAVQFGWDMHHESPTRPRELYLSSVDYQLEAPQGAIDSLLREALGEGREVVQPERSHFQPLQRWREHGSFYVRCDLDAAQARLGSLRWEASRPEWAIPPIAPGPLAALLERLVAALRTETEERAVLARIAPQLAPCGVKASFPVMFSPDGRESSLSLLFEPALSLRLLLEALGWSDAIAYAASVHMDAWTVLPDAEHTPTDANVGPWVVQPSLMGWPRGPRGAELPRLEGGPFTRYALAGCAVDVGSILVVPASVYA